MKSFFYVIVTLVFSYVACNAQSNMQEAVTASLPYPPSDVIAELVIDTARISIGHGDNWAITWADDDLQYSFFTDGKGFGAHALDVSISPVSIEGDPPNISGKDIPSTSGTLEFLEGGEHSAKVCGLVMIDKVLYAWVRNINLPGTPKGTGSQLMVSKDYGKSWEYADWNWPTIGYPTWLNAGKNNAEAKDGYAYFVSPNGPSAYYDYPDMLMARVPNDRIVNKDSYEFFTGTDAKGNPTWGTYENRKAVFHNEEGSFRPDIVYNPGLDRYFLTVATPIGPWQWWAKENDARTPHFGMFESENPWGPWKTVYYEKDWGSPENRFSPHIPSKWISGEGTSFYLLYSCIPNGPYRFNIQKCTLVLKE
ncbi:hypothetical protein [Maribacter sp. 2-571]|uniref:hypothetical protein n=1 Tax=Maribacter sp. 2-571 TaxID=3417569 RepID=UPI003D3457CC